MDRKVIAITTTKTARHQGAKEYFVTDYGSYEAAVAAALAAHPRKRKFYELLMYKSGFTVATPVTLERRKDTTP